MKEQLLKPQQTAALTRFRVVNHLEESIRGGLGIAEALREAASRPWPDESGRCYAFRTLEDWFYAHRKGGFQALTSAERSDKGGFRVIGEELGLWLQIFYCGAGKTIRCRTHETRKEKHIADAGFRSVDRLFLLTRPHQG